MQLFLFLTLNKIHLTAIQSLIFVHQGISWNGSTQHNFGRLRLRLLLPRTLNHLLTIKQGMFPIYIINSLM